MLREYYNSLPSKELKNKFFDLAKKKCKVSWATVNSWLAKPSANHYRLPKPVYRAILCKLTKLKEDELFFQENETNGAGC